MDKPKHSNTEYYPLPDLSNYDPEPADGVRVGESPVPGLTLKRILRAHTDVINRMTWSNDGNMLATPSSDGTIGIWNIESGEVLSILKGHREKVYCAVWLPDNRTLASGAWDETITLWDTATGKPLRILRGGFTNALAWSPDTQLLVAGTEVAHVELWNIGTGESAGYLLGYRGNINNLAPSPDGHFIAGPSGDGSIRVWNLESHRLIQTLEGHTDYAFDSSWSPDGHLIYSCSWDGTIRIWDVATGRQMSILQGHLSRILSCSTSFDGLLLATKSHDNTVRIWNLDTYQTVVTLEEQSSQRNSPGLAFHPHFRRLATLGENDTVVRIWDIDMEALLGQPTTGSVRYTTAKLVLVGDSGVGKTGLGWRLAHGEFKEQASTHGQQFWVIKELGKKREDGTECEAVLWDLAGQHVYRPIHSIFLDNVDASLVLFDPSNRQDPLKGAQFWLEQLRGKGQLPPSVLVGARVDVSPPALSQQEFDQFCQRYGISGGYISTSAKRGDGLDALLDRLRAQIPWDKMTTTVTTVTFKRIKDYVLALKEKPDRQGVLVSPGKLREQLEAAWRAGEKPFNFAQGDAVQADWQFTDAEMMTAVGHLETHGYVTILKSSSGEAYILLAPDLLVDLASSIVLLADKHPRELGAVSETELLRGRYPFDELAGLDEAERHILLDAAVLRFLEHNVCFRETFGSDTLLIFPGLIKQKRPLEDDFPAADDVSYVVRGRVENLYAMLVVLLGYTPSFTRINQWQNQAQYEMGQDEICGFRLIEDREGEIELVLYHSEQMPPRGRASFQELFERFLYQREVEVTRFQPVVCPQGHRLERATVVRLIREGKTFAFCAECGGRANLPELDRPGIGTSASEWLQREEAAAHLRSTYEAHLARVKGYRRGWATPRCYLSRVPGQENCVTSLIHDLQDAGVYIIEEVAQVQPDDYVVMLDTPAYQRLWRNPTQAFAAEVKLVKDRMAGDKRRLISIVREGNKPAAPHDLRGCIPGDFCDATHYPVSLFNLVLNLYAIPFDHAGFAPLRESLHQQWFASAEIQQRTQEMQEQSAIELDTESKERALVGAVISTVALAGQLCREFNVSDKGIDVEIEFNDAAGDATGHKLYLQLKSGDSHLRQRKTDGTEVFKIKDERHAQYWMDQAFPVMLVIRTSDGEIRWMEIRDWLKRASDDGKKKVRQIIFEGERFDVMSVRRWRDAALG